MRSFSEQRPAAAGNRNEKRRVRPGQKRWSGCVINCPHPHQRIRLMIFAIFVYAHVMKTPNSASFIAARLLLIAAFALCLSGLASTGATAAELLVVGRDNCPYCRAWEVEIGARYNDTVESDIARLRRIDIDDIARAPYDFREPVRYTPTFILIDRHAEIGRIVGYADPASFWGSLHALLAKLEPRPAGRRPKPICAAC